MAEVLKKNTAANIVKIRNRVADYLDWPKIWITTAFLMFEQTHGIGKIEAMGRFMDWAEKNKKRKGWIAAAMGHDLNGANDPDMSPRTGGY